MRVLAIDQVGSVLDAGLGAGANQLEGVSFALQDRTQPYLDALATATQEARRKAEAIAAAAGMVVGGIIEISEETAGAPQPFLARAGRLCGGCRSQCARPGGRDCRRGACARTVPAGGRTGGVIPIADTLAPGAGRAIPGVDYFRTEEYVSIRSVPGPGAGARGGHVERTEHSE